MTVRKKRIFWDSNVFITLLSKLNSPERLKEQDICKRYLQSAIDGETEIFTSTLAVVEVSKTQESSPPVPDEIKAKIRNLFNEPYVKLISVDLARANEARELIWTHSWLKPPDAVHVACALYARVDELFSYDGGKEKGILNLNNLVGTPPLTIVKPHYEGQDRMAGL
jgi:predicted nucleic acid-binding protein